MKLKVSEVAKELGLKSKEVVEIAKEIGVPASIRGGISPMDAMKIEEYIKNKHAKPQPEKKVEKQEPKKEEKAEEKPKRKRRSSFNELVKKTQKGIQIVQKAPKAPKEEPKKEEKVEAKAEKPKTQPQPEQKQEKSEKPKPKKTKKPAPKKHVEEKELEINVDLAEMDVIEENQVELLDLYFNDIAMKDEEKLEEKAKTKTQIENQKEAKKQQQLKKQKAAKKSGGITKTAIKKKKKKKKKEKEVEVIKIPKEVRVYEFAEAINKPLEDVIEALRELGEERDKNDFLGEEYIETLAEEFDVPVEIYDPLAEFDYVKKYDEQCPEEEFDTERPPIVTIMGHVDHGKTSLLDRIRNSRIAAKEAGGITQHIGAYMVEKDGKKITFIDTPGHEAFTEMRARGAQVTDIAIIVVAANDGVMPQTREAIAHAQAAGVPFIVAVNKIDLPEANPDLVKSQLAEMGIMPVEWGGEYEFVNVSAKTGEGIDDLLETILLQAEMMELKANPKCPAKAVVIESRVEKGKGPVATVIVKNGTLKKQDSFVCGKTFGRVRLIIDDLGKQKKEVLPGEPAEITGFDEAPFAGDTLVAVESDRIAKETAEKWKEYLERREKSKTTKATLEDLQKMILEGNLKKLPVIVKADTQGSVEAIKGSLAKLKNEEVKVDIIHSDVGAITENDVILAKASEPHAIILGFNVRPTTQAKNKAKQEGIEIRTYSIIYDLIDDVKELLSGLMTPKIKEQVTATVEVRDVFNVPKVGTVAGCYVQDGVVHRGDFVRVIRDGVVIYDSKLASLKRFKDDVKEVGKGFECGIMVEGYNDVKVGDILETYQKIEEKAKFE
ncbi:translation initiation factor IF-2 [Caminibacter pacificus]|uniref:Translation initiation factor IF-2 n=1 Tax=Caminibacter pacificus TaxID=1424653 RepID=A0AAJ4UY05_9BACT|nr:translation initiation factor IF-2 [Caminibacter pacificus]QCI27740.1 translation initiation factor IF-2 [Caminibacter pacificus]ROR40086.1 translation initiation factor 2 (bIF-2) [Caminibacter pacificus]